MLLQDIESRRRKFVFEEEMQVGEVTERDIIGIDRELVNKLLIMILNCMKLFVGALGVLIEGRPGIGKTTLVKYIATQLRKLGIRVIDATKFPKPHSYWTPDDVRELFKLAREYVARSGTPIVIVWEDVDTVFRKRRYLSIHEAQVLTTLLNELEGLTDSNRGIVLIATAVNSLEMDEALLRPGRLGTLRIKLSEPSPEVKVQILKRYVEDYPHDPDIDYEALKPLLDKVVETPADIKNLVEKTWIAERVRAVAEHREPRITFTTLVETMLGKEYMEAYVREKRSTLPAALHTAAELIIAHEVGVPVELVVVREDTTSTYLGREESTPQHEYTRKLIMIELGKYIVEEITGIHTTNSTHHLRRATELALKYLLEQGKLRGYEHVALRELIQDDLWRLTTSLHQYTTCKYQPSEELKKQIEQELRKLVQESYVETRKILEQYGRDNIINLAKEILKRKYIPRHEIQQLVEKYRRKQTTVV
ncbi:MAG: hypothetical protein DRJ40_06215 [Thermoprotei archaeon]|nr:MAG: hypothetical protein DRJ40_06215 [Thermoprotei archaeon]